LPATRAAGALGEDEGDDADDWKEHVREERMLKRVKKGDVSKKDFDAEFLDL